MSTSEKTVTAPFFRMPLELRWSDLDAFDHVNNARYLTFLEEARIRWFDSIGEAWVTDEFAPVVASVQLNYRMPIPYPAEVMIELYSDRIGTSSVTIGHRIVSADGKTLYNDGHVIAVWIDRKTGKARALPDSIRKVVEQ